jgi:hypothetical protein
MDTLINFSSICGGIFLAITLLWVAHYNFRRSETSKAIAFFIAGLSIAIILIYSILNTP